MKEKDITPYEESLELKELGFDEPCFGEWQNLKTGKNLVVDDEDRIYNISVLGADIKAPTFSQAFRWFREKYKFDLTIKHNKKYVAIVYSSVKNFSIDEYETFEEAELECLKKLIKIVKQIEKK